MHQCVVVKKTILKFTLKHLQHVSVLYLLPNSATYMHQLSSLAQQPHLSQVLLQKLLPAVPIPCSIPPVSLPPNFLASPITPSSHLSFGLPLCLLPSTTATRTLLIALCSSVQITCPAHFNRLILIPPLYMRSVVDRNVVTQHITVFVMKTYETNRCLWRLVYDT